MSVSVSVVAVAVAVVAAAGEVPVLRAVATGGSFGVRSAQTARRGAAELAFALPRVQRYGSVAGHVPGAGEGAHP